MRLNQNTLTLIVARLSVFPSRSAHCNVIINAATVP